MHDAYPALVVWAHPLQLWLRVFPDIPVSSKPAEVRMGKGKGYVCNTHCIPIPIPSHPI
jgi:ribosomal protein L16/L10AE